VDRAAGQFEPLLRSTRRIHGIERPVEADALPFELPADPASEFRDGEVTVARQHRFRLHVVLLVGRSVGHGERGRRLLKAQRVLARVAVRNRFDSG